MASWKIKPHTLSTTYDDSTGYTFTLNPKTFSVITNKQIEKYKIPFSDRWIIINQGSSPSELSIEGILYNKDDYENLSEVVAKSNLNSTLQNTINNVLRLYVDSDRFYLVTNGNVQLNRTAVNPLGYAYVITFLRIDPFVYDETLNSAYKSGSSTLVFNKTNDIGTNDGSAYALPYFQITNSSGSNITSVSITDTVNTLTWTGTLASGKTLYIIQDYVKESYGPEPTGIIDDAVSGSVSGNYIHFPAGSTPLGNITITASNTISAYIKWRERYW